MRYLLTVAVLAGCTNNGDKEPTSTLETGDVGKRVLEACGDPPRTPTPDYHYWASYTTWPDQISYALLYEDNWHDMVSYVDAERTWRDCVVGLD